MTRLKSLVPVLVILILFTPASAIGAKRPASDSAVPSAAVLREFEFEGELDWFYRTDVGMLLLYGDGRLHRADLLQQKPEALPAVEFPGLAEPRSVFPIAGTGLLLIPGASAGRLDRDAGGGNESSYAIDILEGKVAWEAPALDEPNLLFSFPDEGLAVVRSFQGEGSLYAVDLATGNKAWDRALRAVILWVDGPYIRLVAGGSLLTLDRVTGETVRKDGLSIPKETRLYSLHAEDVLVFWKNKHLEGYSLPPVPPAKSAPLGRLWEFTAGSPMINLCIKGGACDIDRVGQDRLLVSSGRRFELLKISTGERILDVKRGIFPSPVTLSPSGRYVTVAAGEALRVYDGQSGDLVREVKYPKGGEGMKSLRYLRWLDDERVMMVFPDKKGNPRKMTSFSCEEGSLLWSLVLPEVADYQLTDEQRAKLIGRITASLVATAVSAGNPMNVGGTSYVAVFAPNLDVSYSLDAGGAVGSGGEGSGAGDRPDFSSARQRRETCDARAESGAWTRHFVVGDRGSFEILRIDLESGAMAPVVRYASDRVHSISPFTPFARALSVESNNRKVRLISLEP